MQDQTTGWVVENQNHPNTNSKHIVTSSFRRTRSEAIAAFIKDSGKSWEYWRRNYNFRCVKAVSIIQTPE